MTSDKSTVTGTLAHAQRQAVEDALQRSGYNLVRAAKRLQISRTTLYRLMERYGLDKGADRRATAPARPAGSGDPAAQVHFRDGNWYLSRAREVSS